MALALLAPETPRTRLDWAITQIQAFSPQAFLCALAAGQIDQLFLRAATEVGLLHSLPPALLGSLRRRRIRVAATQLRQDHVLAEASRILDDIGARQVVFKGALVRSCLYDEPHLRPAADIDLLIEPDTAQAASQAFARRGYRVGRAAHSDTHELALTRSGVEIDLHWSLLRPGRMRQDITCEILGSRVRRGELWSPSDTHLTVIMLVHPAITDHVTARLISAVDLDRWVRSRPLPWPAVIEVLGRISLRTAAWAMLRWTHALFRTPVPDDVWRALAPSTIRQRYLEAWLRRDPARLYQQHPNLVRSAFSLALQDRASDAARALWRLARKARLSLE